MSKTVRNVDLGKIYISSGTLASKSHLHSWGFSCRDPREQSHLRFAYNNTAFPEWAQQPQNELTGKLTQQIHVDQGAKGEGPSTERVPIECLRAQLQALSERRGLS